MAEQVDLVEADITTLNLEPCSVVFMNYTLQFLPPEQRLTVLQRIRQALSDSEFELYYQPKVNLNTGDVIGAEALLRWNHPEEGLIIPAYFLPLVKDHALSELIGEWVIYTGLRQLQAWTENGLDLSLSVNIDAYHIQQENFVERLGKMIGQFPDVDVSRLQLEILETSSLELAQVSTVIHQCQEMGVALALDDFGTGYSSLSYLKHLQVSTLKIDRSFVRDMLEDPEDLAIVEGVIGLARAFRLEVIAEGIETEEHGEMIQRIGCELGQGYAIARPMPADQLALWITSWKPPASWQQVVQVRYQNHPIMFAIIEHRAWVNQLHQYLVGQTPKPPELDETECRTGSWLVQDGKKRYQALKQSSLCRQIDQAARVRRGNGYQIRDR